MQDLEKILLENKGEIKHLDLSQQGLTEIPQEIYSLYNLEELILTNNQLTILPDALFSLPKLKQLNLKKNKIKEIPSSILQASSLEVLNFNFNQLTELPKELFEVTTLTDLYFSHNQLKEIPFVINNLKRLNSLNVRNNELEQLPVSLAHIQALSQLHLIENKLILIPSSLFKLPKLYFFNWKKQRGAIPPQVGDYLEEVEHIALTNKGMKSIPKEVFLFTELKKLDLSQNKITQIPNEIEALKRLKILHIHNNQLNDIPVVISKLEYLEELMIHKNPIENFPMHLLALPRLKTVSSWGYKPKTLYPTVPSLDVPQLVKHIMTVIRQDQNFSFSWETKQNLFSLSVDELSRCSQIPLHDFLTAITLENWNIFYNASQYLVHILNDEIQILDEHSELVFWGENTLLSKSEYVERLELHNIKIVEELTDKTTHLVLTFPSPELPSEVFEKVTVLSERVLNHFLQLKSPKHLQEEEGEQEQEQQNIIQLLNHEAEENFELAVSFLYALGVSTKLLYHIIIVLFERRMTEQQQLSLERLIYLYGTNELYQNLKKVLLNPDFRWRRTSLNDVASDICKGTELSTNVFYRYIDKKRI
ncbi:MAG: leucine-rich repeat protein [Cytophagales bacterium]|nr:leucine-rich repeat protein [Cytophagales bacterium]